MNSFDRGDVQAMAALLALAPAAPMPQRLWPLVCRFLARIYVAAVPKKMPALTWLPDEVVEQMGGEGGFHVQLVAIRFEMWLQALRAYLPRGWKPKLRLVGADRIEEARRQGRGVVLWISQLSAHQLPQKMAFWNAGYRLYHLSQPDHPMSGTRFGRRFLNPLVTRVEDRYLAERLMMRQDGGRAADPALRALRRQLSQNDLVSITVSETAGRLESVPFFAGRLWLPTGPATLALTAGAPILPVFTIKTAPDSYEVRVEAPLPLSATANRKEAIRCALASYAQLLETYVEVYARQWVGPLTLGDVNEEEEGEQPELMSVAGLGEVEG
jgi:lauroyl/myristoyl acyltransferase